MVSLETLRARTVKDLAQLAREQGVDGWHSMRKEQLVRALYARGKTRASSGSRKAAATRASAAAKRAAKEATLSPAAIAAARRRGQDARRLSEMRDQQYQWKDLSAKSAGGADDCLVVMVRDPFWLHASWKVSRESVDRAEAALAQQWHDARPVLRLYRVGSELTSSRIEEHLRDIDVHGGVDNWYIDVADPPSSFRLDIGYLATNGRFHSLARSNVVTTPSMREARGVDRNWTAVAEDYDRIYAMSSGYTSEGDATELREALEQRLRRPIGRSMVSRITHPADLIDRNGKDFFLKINAELVLHGVTRSDAYVTIDGEPVRLDEGGVFTMRFDFPDRRQIMPIVARSGDGVEERTSILAVERNTKYMEPVVHELND